MPWGAAIGAVGAIGGALISSQGAKSAASAQAEAGQAAIAGQERMLASQQALEEPYRKGGLEALQQLLIGTAPGGQFAQPFKMEESQTQQFATKEALNAMQNQMAVGGQGLSTNAIIGAGKTAANIGAAFEGQAFNQWLANQQQQFGQLQNIAGMGQAAASGQAANIGQAGANIANLQTGIGNVQAAGQAGSANALGGAVGSVGQYLMLQNMMNQNNTGGTSSTATAGNILQSVGLE